MKLKIMVCIAVQSCTHLIMMLKLFFFLRADQCSGSNFPFLMMAFFRTVLIVDVSSDSGCESLLCGCWRKVVSYWLRGLSFLWVDVTRSFIRPSLHSFPVYNCTMYRASIDCDLAGALLGRRSWKGVCKVKRSEQERGEVLDSRSFPTLLFGGSLRRTGPRVSFSPSVFRLLRDLWGLTWRSNTPLAGLGEYSHIIRYRKCGIRCAGRCLGRFAERFAVHRFFLEGSTHILRCLRIVYTSINLSQSANCTSRHYLTSSSIDMRAPFVFIDMTMRGLSFLVQALLSFVFTLESRHARHGPMGEH